jgi:hypothetical protein
MNDIESALRSRVSGFVSELSDLIRHHALVTAEAVLRHGPEAMSAPAAAAAPPVKRGRGRPRKVPLPATPAPVAAAAAPAPAAPVRSRARAGAAAKRSPGEKRSPMELAQLTEQTFNYIRANPGQGVEQISKSLGTPTRDLTLPLRKLMVSKKISSKGVKRATRYYPRS